MEGVVVVGTQGVGGGRGMHRVERRDSSCQVEDPVHVAGRRDRLLGKMVSILSSLILEVCWEEETTTITVVVAVTTAEVSTTAEASTTEASTTTTEASTAATTTITISVSATTT